MSHQATLLVNLGSPDHPDTSSVRDYLNQFLMDPYVIQQPWIVRRLIVSLLVLPRRPTSSADAYKSIWFDDGSPLIVLSEQLTRAVQNKVDMPVAMAMRYGNPSIESQLLALTKNTDIDEVIFIPLYPHYAESTVKTSIEQAKKVIEKHQLNIKLTVVKPFYNDAAYIYSLVSSAQPYLEQSYDHLLFSYHGLPESHITQLDSSGTHHFGDDDCCSSETCYRHHIFETTRCFVEQAKIPKDKYSIAFQSRLGREKWLSPNTEDRLRELAQSGAKNILVICPAFVTDCLETLEEIALRGQEVFTEAGGETLTLIPCLNDHDTWVATLSKWIKELNTTQ